MVWFVIDCLFFAWCTYAAITAKEGAPWYEGRLINVILAFVFGISIVKFLI